MYETKNKTNLVSLILKIVIAILLVILCIKLVSILVDNKKNDKANDTMKTNLTKMEKVAKKYFTGDLIPAASGDSVKINLERLISEEKIEEIKDESGKKCDYKESYVELTKLDTEYQVKSYLVCPSKTDFINSFIKIKDDDKTTTTTTKVVNTTKKTTQAQTKTTTTAATTTSKKIAGTVETTTTVVKKYLVEFNSNGGSEVAPVYVNEHESVTLPTPVREGYTFAGWYLNNNKVNTLDNIESNLVLLAKWSKN